MLFDFLGIVVALLVTLIAYYKWTYQYWKRKNLPYLEPQIPYGHLGNTIRGKDNIATTIRNLYSEIKSRGWRHAGVYFVLSPNYFPIDLDDIKNILTKDFQHFVNRNLYFNEKDDPLSAHLVHITDSKWKNMRAKLTPTFTSGKMKMMFNTLVECEADLQKQLTVKSETREATDIKDVLARFTINVIGSCAFGLDCKTFENEDAPFRVFGRKAVTTTRLRNLKRTFSSNFKNLAKLVRMTNTPKDVADFYMKVVHDVVTYRETNNITRNDFMQMLIDLKNNRLDVDGKKCEGGLTMNEIAAQSFVFFVAGFETSSTLMTFTLYELAKNQYIQQKLREEIDEVVTKHDGKITYDALHDMEYMSQVIDESLRKHPPAPLTNRVCLKDYKLPDSDVIIEKGTTVIIPIIGIHYDEDYYPDPEKFDSDRFSEENKRNRHHYTFLPFGEGPRNCIGMRFGLMEAKFALASVIRNFRFTVNRKTKEPLKIRASGALRAAEGDIWLNVEKICRSL